MRTIQVRTRYAPWLSSATIELMKERDIQQTLASESNSRDEWVKFKSLRNRINNRLKNLKKEIGRNSGWRNVEKIQAKFGKMLKGFLIEKLQVPQTSFSTREHFSANLKNWQKPRMTTSLTKSS